MGFNSKYKLNNLNISLGVWDIIGTVGDK